MFRMLGLLLVQGLVLLLAPTTPAAAYGEFPQGSVTKEIATNSTTLHARVGGHGPAVVPLPGFGYTGDMWSPPPPDLARQAHPTRPMLMTLPTESPYRAERRMVCRS
jgi:hypothetical protein